MKYLFIDASESVTYAQVGNDNSFEKREFDTNRDFASKITVICDKILEVGGFSIEEIDTFAVGIGPGSLTGIRVAASFMRTLAMIKKCELVGVNRFLWALKTLSDIGEKGAVRIVTPTLIDKAFSICCELPNLDYGSPELIERSAIPKDGVKTYGISYSDNFVNEITSSPQALHDLILNDKKFVDRANNLPEILNILPLYIIPSQAERKLKTNDKERQ